jgi:hypothetical protein
MFWFLFFPVSDWQEAFAGFLLCWKQLLSPPPISAWGVVFC